jgi:hypothetical protein
LSWHRYHRGGKYEEITDRADAPLEDAVALMVRERLTGHWSSMVPISPSRLRPARSSMNSRHSPTIRCAACGALDRPGAAAGRAANRRAVARVH